MISDIHGCYGEYTALLKKINFSDRDYLYILGDAADGGSDLMDVLKDMMRRNNVTFIIGNHDCGCAYIRQCEGMDIMIYAMSDIHGF